jgi:transposase
MMLVPVFIPLAFLGLEQVLARKAEWKSWETPVACGLFFLALATLVKIGLYDRTIWHVPAWTTVIWVGACDVLYGALGFPVIIVTAVAAGMLVAIKLAVPFGSRLSLTGQRLFRLAVIAVATAGLASFNIATGFAGARFAWDQPYVAINAAHARAIIAIIGDRSRDPRPAIVTVDPAVSNTIEATTGIKAPTALDWELIPNRRVADSLGDSRITWGMIQGGKRRGFAMGQAIAVRTDFTAGEVRRFAKRAKDAAQARRLLAIAAVLEGASREDAAKMGGMDRQTLRDWVLRFNEQGPDGLINIPSPGMPPKLGKKHRAFLARLVEEGPIPAVDGVVRWRACDLIMRLYEEFRLSVSDDTVYRALKDLGFSHVSARPKAYKQDADAMEAFKKTLPTAWRKSVPSSRRVHL